MEGRSVQERQPTGWTYFAGSILFIVGSLDALWGLAAILNNDIVIVGGHGAIVANITTWGWVHLILGSVMALAGLGLFAGSSGARSAISRGPPSVPGLGQNRRFSSKGAVFSVVLGVDAETPRLLRSPPPRQQPR
jgi:hypothetical protein